MQGEVVYLFAFDVASEIETAKVKDILAGTPVPFEIQADHTLPKDLPIYKPLSIEHTPLAATLAGAKVRPFIHIYDIGVVSIAMRVAFEAPNLADLMPFHKPVLENGQPLAEAARELCIEACQSLEKAMVQPAPLPEPEAYTVFCLTDIGAKNLQNWAAENRNTIAELLTENKPDILSEMQIGEVLRLHYSYTNTDLTVIDWDAALVVDLTGYVEDTLYVLELANLQLEEYRVMDQRLDRYLNRAYEDVHRRRSSRIFSSYATMLNRLRTLRMDVTKLNDEVTHITKFFGDWYLARVYLGARERFHLSEWKSSVEERLKQIDALYTVAHTELFNRRMFWLEVLIVIFFAIDLLGIFLWRRG